MQMASRPRQYLPGSAPDIVARLHHALEATETARILMRSGVEALDSTEAARVVMHSSLEALELHLDQLDAHLRRLIADIEGRTH